MKNASEISEESRRVANNLFRKIRAYDRLIAVALARLEFDTAEKLTINQEKIRAELRAIIF